MVKAYIEKEELVIKLSLKEEILSVSKGEIRIPIKNIEYASIEPIPKPSWRTGGTNLGSRYLLGHYITEYNGERLKSFYVVENVKEALVIIYNDDNEKNS